MLKLYVKLFINIFLLQLLIIIPKTTFTFKSKNVTVINNNKNKMCIERWIRCFEFDEAL